MGNRGPQAQFSMMVPMTPLVKWLIIVNSVIWFVAQLLLGKVIFGQPDFLVREFGLVPHNVLSNFFLWEPLTYMFLHALSPFHIIFNMLLLWWLGAELEQRWGSKFFAAYYFASGIGAAIIYVLGVLLYSVITGETGPAWLTPVVGASGAIFGLMLAYGILFGDRVVYFMMIFPMRAKWFVTILGVAEVLTLLNSGFGSDVANLAHLGGLIAGFLFLMTYTRFQQLRWRKQSGRRGRGLRLVVNNDRKDEKDDKGGNGGPKYWN
jgi:membrane associated rhomboid family serine protease